MTLEQPKSKTSIEDFILFALLSIIFLILYIIGSRFFRFVLLLFFGMLVLAYVISRIIKIFTESKIGLTFAYWGNEILYAVLGIPILVIAIFYLPVAIFLMFSGEVSVEIQSYIKWGVLILTIILQISSITVFIIKVFREKKAKKEKEEELF